MRIINDSVRFPEKISGGRVLNKTYKTYPFYVSQATVALQGIDYGFSDEEGPFFRSTIDCKSQVISPYEVQVTITFGFRGSKFEKRTDAIVNYTLLLFS
ncbi:hypothetical protein [Clostridium sp. 'White wine YQ']|uniref:hypothetical protein n=1 Tax=Clostridium sp. 'White wine YQ' TaxID=3027474 RepID=UPI0023650504|nr:hypothetical protein [Clostridium sp. 'White wine YQ']MDD7793631.1 hypothetical protein [Clostridium sp. 'White wine YQ']